MDALDALHTRNSVSRLNGSVSADQFDQMIAAGLRAPDHAQLRPWRILAVEGSARDRLGALFAQAKLTSEPNVAREQLEKLKAKPLRAPLILIVAATPREHPKVPEVEQILSAGAVAQNILTAAHALGLGAMWRTGEMTFNPMVINGLGLADDDKIVGFLYIGQIDGKVKPLPSIDASQYVTHW